MTKPNYIDQCLERAEKATEGPWYDHYCHVWSAKDAFIDSAGDKIDYLVADTQATHGDTPDRYNDTVFIAHARTDVPELARRLKKACEGLRKADEIAMAVVDYGFDAKQGEFSDLADELEAMPEYG